MQSMYLIFFCIEEKIRYFWIKYFYRYLVFAFVYIYVQVPVALKGQHNILH